MNIQEIDKWLDNEYGVSYTRLEELHDFVIEQDMKHQEEAEKEIERINDKINSIFSNFEQFINSYKNDSLDDFFIVLRLSEVVEFYNDLKEVIKNDKRI